ncbi:MAG: glycosyltransferase family 87 protein [Pseudomonadota bacterium]
MQGNAQDLKIAELWRSAAGFGGPVFAAIILASLIFCFALFALRADKIFALPGAISQASAEDLVAFWRASSMALSGEAAAAYDRLVFQAPLAAPNDNLIWWNPPHAFLMIWPLALLPYGAAKLLWLGASIAALAWIVRLAQPTPFKLVAILLSPAAFASLLVLQTGPFFALGLLTAFLMADRRPLLSGLLLAVLTVKPQYGLMAPIFLAAIGAWRAFGAAVIFTLALSFMSAMIFGVEVWRQFFAVPVADYAAAGLHRDMVSISHSLQKAGLSQSVALTMHVGVATAAAGLVWVAARRAPRDAAIGLALLASALAAPVIWIYDWPLVAAGIFMLTRSASPMPISIQIIMGLAWLGPLYSLGFGTMASSLAAPALLALLAAGAGWRIVSSSP